MPTFSRWMPPKPSHSSGGNPVVGWITVALLIAIPIALVIVSVEARVVFGLLLAIGTAGTVVGNRKWDRMAGERASEDIGTFVRALDRRAEWFDPWVVRAVWDALRDEWNPPIALRPTDRLAEDLDILSDDLSLDVLPTIAARTGRTFDHPETNPYYGRVVTVLDLIRFVAAQPSSRTA